MHPILFEIKGFFVGSYGVLIMFGVVAALALAMGLARRRRLPPEFFYDLAFVALLSGFVGARLLFAALEWDQLTEDPLGVLFSRSGFVFLGGLVFASVASLFFIFRRGMPVWETADVVAPALALAHAFGRVGCWFAGCCYGKVVSPDHPWAVRFPKMLDEQGELRFSFAYLDHLERGLVDRAAEASAPVIPTQLIETATNLLVCAGLLLLWTRRRFAGQIFAAYLVAYGVARFGLEFARGDSGRGGIGPLSTSQIISLAGLGVAAILWAVLSRNASPDAALNALARKEAGSGGAEPSAPEPARTADGGGKSAPARGGKPAKSGKGARSKPRPAARPR